MLEERFVGELMRDIRKQKGLTTIQLASQLNISQPKLSRIENGTQSVNIPLLYQFCEIFDMTLSDFFQLLEGRLEYDRIIKESKREYNSLGMDKEMEQLFASLNEKQKMALLHFIKSLKEGD